MLATASLLFTQPVSAQQVAWPTKPVTFVVPFAAGGSTDALARAIAKKVSAQWGQPVLIDNRPGAGTTVGTAFVARAPADGHTVLFANAPLVITQYAYANLNYDGRRDFAPVTLLTSSPDGHLKLLHSWPPKLPQAGRIDYGAATGLKAIREAASLSL